MCNLNLRDETIHYIDEIQIHTPEKKKGSLEVQRKMERRQLFRFYLISSRLERTTYSFERAVNICFQARSEVVVIHDKHHIWIRKT